MTVKDLNQLHPRMFALVSELLAACNDVPMYFVVLETYRSPERQEALYSQGRTEPGKIVTNGRPGWSWHQWRRAVDLGFAGSNPWDPKAPWDKLGELGERLGLRWGGRWKSRDLGHFELPGACSLGLRVEARDGTLKLGAKGSFVEELQLRLTQAGSDPGVIDGHFGKHTEAAVLRLQTYNINLDETGAVDVPTIEAIEDLLAERAAKAGQQG